MEGHILEVVFYLAVIVGLIITTGFLLRKVHKNGFQVAGPLKVVASLSLGIKEKVVLVQIGEQQQILLGVCPERITRLEGFDEPIVVFDSDGLESFREKLRHMMKHGPT